MDGLPRIGASLTYIEKMEALRCASSHGDATIAVDVDGDGIADYLVSGADRDGDGIPDALQVIMPDGIGS